MKKNINIKTKWKLKSLYPSEKELEKHVETIERTYIRFEKKYRGKDFTSTANKLYSALQDYEALLEIAPTKPGFYFGLAHSIDSGNQRIESQLNLITQKLSSISNRIVFLNLEIGKIDIRLQQKYLKSKKLKQYRYLLSKIFLQAQHYLSEKEEQMLGLLSLPSYDMWVRGVEKVQNKLEIHFKGKTLAFTEALEMTKTNLSIQDRRVLHSRITKALHTVEHFAEAEMNAVVTGKKIEDDLRSFEKPFSATILQYENIESEVLGMVETVSLSYTLSHRFYALKKKMLNLKDMQYIDRLAPIGEIKKKFDFTSSVYIVREALYHTDTDFGAIFDRLIGQGQVDVFPVLGKRSGAFCAGNTGTPTFVLLNHTNDFSSLSTLAHEMGHAIHTELSKKQPLWYQNYPISLAEVASTLFENIVFHQIFDTLSEKEKVIALHDKLDRTMATIFRQVAFFKFEMELHHSIRSRGSLSHLEMATLFSKHLQDYLGKSVKVTPDDGYSFIYVPHFRSMFYVYAYVYGEMISHALYERYRADYSFISCIKQFLSAGSHTSPYEIFKKIGIDTKNSAFWKAGIENIGKDINIFENLIIK